MVTDGSPPPKRPPGEDGEPDTAPDEQSQPHSRQEHQEALYPQAPTPERRVRSPGRDLASGRSAAQSDEELVLFPPDRGLVPVEHPTDPIGPFIRRGPRRRPRDWPILVLALVTWALITTGCCIAGFAIYTAYVAGPP